MSANTSQLERLTFFSDAVFAIAITLLIIEVHVPHVSGVDDALYWQALAELRSSLFGFALSFLVIGMLWMAHHRVFGMLNDYSPKLMWPNLLLLMTRDGQLGPNWDDEIVTGCCVVREGEVLVT